MQIPRSEPFVAAVNGRIYVFGGFLIAQPPGRRSAVGEVYDPVADSWQPRAPMPQPRATGFAVVGGDTIYAIGGSDTDFATTTFVDAYDTTTDTWTEKRPRPDLLPVYLIAAAFLQGRIFLFVSDPDEFQLLHVEAYDPESDTWSSEPSVPLRRLIDVEVVDDSLLVFNAELSSVSRYVPGGALTEEGEMPSLRGTYFLQTASANDKVYAFVQDPDGTVLEYDPINRSWRGPLEDVPAPVYVSSFTPVTVNGTTWIHAIGGFEESFHFAFLPPGSVEAPTSTPTPTPSASATPPPMPSPTPIPSSTPIIVRLSGGCTLAEPHAGGALACLPIAAVLAARALARRLTRMRAGRRRAD